MGKFYTVKNVVGPLGTRDVDYALPMGTRHVGGLGGVTDFVDTDAICDRITAELGLLTPQQLATIKETVAKFSGRPAGPTSAAGVTANDAVSTVRRELAHNRAIAMSYKAFWDKRAAQDANRSPLGY